jgi:hypothetical protein
MKVISCEPVSNSQYLAYRPVDQLLNINGEYSIGTSFLLLILLLRGLLRIFLILLLFMPTTTCRA